MLQARKAFTLIELLVVIAIIAILASILFPVFAQAKAAAKKTSSLSNIKQQELGLIMYAGDYDDRYICEWPYNNFWGGTTTLADGNHTFHPYTNPYIKSKAVWSSPGAGTEVYTSVNVFGTSDPAGNDANLTGGYSMAYLMNETGWSDNNYAGVDTFLDSGLSASVLSHPAEQVQLFEAAGTPCWMMGVFNGQGGQCGGGGYQVGLSYDGGSSTIPQPSNPNQVIAWNPTFTGGGATATSPGFYNVPGANWGNAGIPSFVNYRFGVPGNNVSLFDGHVKFALNLQLKNVQPYYYNWDNIATNW